MGTKIRVFGVFLLILMAEMSWSDKVGIRERQSKIIELKQGPIQGLILDFVHGDRDLLGRSVQVFRGIPFAAPPLNSLRFLPPVTASSWKEVRKAFDFGPVCPQNLPETRNRSRALQQMSAARLDELLSVKKTLRNQSEDCLYLNVYSPFSEKPTEKSNLLPVVLFIHGDNYEWGGGNIYDPSVFALYGQVVVITLNYRLGIFGFLNANLGSENQHPANLGILDQIAALHWIQENVVSFGGDPTNVSLMGHGTGAASVQFLMTSEALPKGILFHRVILMSGSAISPISISKHPLEATKGLARSLKCNTENSREMLECLRSKSVDVLLSTSRKVMLEERSPYVITWGPSYDGVVVHSFNYDLREYLDRMSHYDLLFGVATADSEYFMNDRQAQYGMDVQERNKILSDFVSGTYDMHQREIFSAIITEYTDWQNSIRHPINVKDGIMMALQDGLYTAPLVETGDYHASQSKNSWFYVFDYQSKNSLFKQRQGAVHGEQLKYIFGDPLIDLAKHPEAEVALSKLVMTLWSNFVSSGNPNTRTVIKSSSRDSDKSRWVEYSPQSKKYLHIGAKSRVRDHFRCKQMAIWLNLIPDLQAAAKASKKFGDSKTEHLNSSHPMIHYHLYNEMVPFVPKLKSVQSIRDLFSPASSEVVWPNATTGVTIGQDSHYSHNNDNMGGVNATYFAGQGFANYSTALSVTIAIGCSLLVLNVLIFAAVYYQKDRSRLQERKLQPFRYDSPQVSNPPPLPNCQTSSSISQYVEGCRKKHSTTSERSAKVTPSLEMSPPRQSVLKQTNKVSIHRLQHLPPPEFADDIPHFDMPNFQTLPRSLTPPDTLPTSLPPPVSRSGTLPLKSSLKKGPKHNVPPVDELSLNSKGDVLRV